MKSSRILLISNVRPSRTWSFANRVLREVPGAEICGIVQRPMHSIPWIQQSIAAGKAREISLIPGQWSKVRFLFHFLVDKIVEWFFWFVHGCPNAPHNSTFTIKRLQQECARTGWLLTVAGEDKQAGVAAFSFRDVDLTIALGEFFSLPEFAVNASNGCIRVCTCKPGVNGKSSGDALISIEHLASGTGAPSTIFSQRLPWQPFDGPLGFTLKADLISDDLVLQSTRSLLAGNLETASTEVSEWAHKILAPSLSQLESKHEDMLPMKPGGTRCRSTWKLCLDTLLLLSPWVLGRNWYRRLSGRYPALILAHHLVSDRPHRMGMSTEEFFRQVLFLRKHYRVVSLSEAIELLGSGEVRVPTVALTFDDGYADNFLNLRAVANEVGISATLFITTQPVETHCEFGHDLTSGMTGFFPLTWDQIKYWSTRGVEFGSHTRTHIDCGTPDSVKLHGEIIGSKNDLEAQLGRSVALFAFPYGRRQNMSSEAMHLAASAYSHFVSCFGGEAPSSDGNLQCHLFRKNLYSNQWELELELQSVFDFAGAIRAVFSRYKKEASDKKTSVPMPPKLNHSMTPTANQSFIDRRSFRRDTGKAGYRSLLP